MSQVIVEEDRLKSRREKSRSEERQINVEGRHQRWQATGTQGLKQIAKAAGIAFIPVALFWALLTGIMTAVICVTGNGFKAIGKAFGGKS